MAYERTNWLPKGTSGAPSINADRLNNIEDGIEGSYLEINKVARETEERYLKICDVTALKYDSNNASLINWVAEEDCWISVYYQLLDRNTTGSCSLKVDDIEVFNYSNNAYYTSECDSFLLPSMCFVRKGSEVSFSRTGCWAGFRAYGCI